MIILLRSSYVFRRICQTKVHLPSQIHSEAKLAPLHHFSELLVVKGSKKNRRLNEFSRCCPSLLSQRLERGRFTLIQDFLFFRIVSNFVVV